MSILKFIKWIFKQVAVPTVYHQELTLMEMILMSLMQSDTKEKTMNLISCV